MAYDEKLAGRVREVLSGRTDVEEKRMFGGLAFMLPGGMCCGIVGDDLMVRVGPEVHDAALARPHARPMDFVGKPMRGMVYVAPAGVRTAAALRRWVESGARFVDALPARSGPSGRGKAAGGAGRTARSRASAATGPRPATRERAARRAERVR